ncbi:MAG: ABC transporter permease [Chloroflexi bacterium]|nr:ABC transporter permease [Chloroflexota bacterium]
MTVRALGLEEPLEAEELRPRIGVWRRLLRRKLAVVCIVVILAIYLAGLLAPWAAPYGFSEVDFDNIFAGPSLEHPFGTDRLGRDMLSRVMWAAQTTVIVSLAAIFTGGLFVGVTLGMLAGYAGGRTDNVIMRVADTFFALPDILLLLIITSTVRPRVNDLFDKFEGWPVVGDWVQQGAPDYFLVFGALSLFGWVGIARVIRSQVLALRESDYVLAARAAGASRRRIIFRHLLPNVSPIIIVALTLSLGSIAGAEVVLTWIGIGIQPPHPSFGAMIFDGSGLTNLRAHPNLLLIPAAVIAVLLYAFNLLGDVLNDIFSPRRR